MSGDLTGKASVEYLMFYKHFDEKDQHKASAVYTGLIRFTGSVNGKTGSFVMRTTAPLKAVSKINIEDYLRLRHRRT